MSEVFRLHSRDNPLLKRVRQLAQDSTAYRRHGQVWLEGDHLCRALLTRGLQPQHAVFAESAWARADRALCEAAPKVAVVPDAWMESLSGLGSAAGMGFVWTPPAQARPLPGQPTVVLDRLQDAGNVGSILRSAAAFGFGQVLALKGCAALWSSKVLRAGMGAHFALHLVEGLAPDAMNLLELPLLVTHVHQGRWLHEETLPWPCAWVLGHEGQGVSEAMLAQATQRLRIVQPGGEESLNVAAAAAVCLHASAVQAIRYTAAPTQAAHHRASR